MGAVEILTIDGSNYEAYNNDGGVTEGVSSVEIDVADIAKSNSVNATILNATQSIIDLHIINWNSKFDGLIAANVLSLRSLYISGTNCTGNVLDTMLNPVKQLEIIRVDCTIFDWSLFDNLVKVNYLTILNANDPDQTNGTLFPNVLAGCRVNVTNTNFVNLTFPGYRAISRVLSITENDDLESVSFPELKSLGPYKSQFHLHNWTLNGKLEYQNVDLCSVTSKSQVRLNKAPLSLPFTTYYLPTLPGSTCETRLSHDEYCLSYNETDKEQTGKALTLNGTRFEITYTEDSTRVRVNLKMKLRMNEVLSYRATKNTVFMVAVNDPANPAIDPLIETLHFQEYSYCNGTTILLEENSTAEPVNRSDMGKFRLDHHKKMMQCYEKCSSRNTSYLNCTASQYEIFVDGQNAHDRCTLFSDDAIVANTAPDKDSTHYTLCSVRPPPTLRTCMWGLKSNAADFVEQVFGYEYYHDSQKCDINPYGSDNLLEYMQDCMDVSFDNLNRPRVQSSFYLVECDSCNPLEHRSFDHVMMGVGTGSCRIRGRTFFNSSASQDSNTEQIWGDIYVQMGSQNFRTELEDLINVTVMDTNTTASNISLTFSSVAAFIASVSPCTSDPIFLQQNLLVYEMDYPDIESNPVFQPYSQRRYRYLRGYENFTEIDPDGVVASETLKTDYCPVQPKYDGSGNICTDLTNGNCKVNNTKWLEDMSNATKIIKDAIREVLESGEDAFITQGPDGMPAKGKERQAGLLKMCILYGCIERQSPDGANHMRVRDGACRTSDFLFGRYENKMMRRSFTRCRHEARRYPVWGYTNYIAARTALDSKGGVLNAPIDKLTLRGSCTMHWRYHVCDMYDYRENVTHTHAINSTHNLTITTNPRDHCERFLQRANIREDALWNSSYCVNWTAHKDTLEDAFVQLFNETLCKLENNETNTTDCNITNSAYPKNASRVWETFFENGVFKTKYSPLLCLSEFTKVESAVQYQEGWGTDDNPQIISDSMLDYLKKVTFNKLISPRRHINNTKFSKDVVDWERDAEFSSLFATNLSNPFSFEPAKENVLVGAYLMPEAGTFKNGRKYKLLGETCVDDEDPNSRFIFNPGELNRCFLQCKVKVECASLAECNAGLEISRGAGRRLGRHLAAEIAKERFQEFTSPNVKMIPIYTNMADTEQLLELRKDDAEFDFPDTLMNFTIESAEEEEEEEGTDGLPSNAPAKFETPSDDGRKGGSLDDLLSKGSSDKSRASPAEPASLSSWVLASAFGGAATLFMVVYIVRGQRMRDFSRATTAKYSSKRVHPLPMST